MKKYLIPLTLMGLASCSQWTTTAERSPASKTGPQYVLMAFDGSMSIPMWKESVAFADELKQKGVELKYTYFVSAVYFLENKFKMVYQGPNKKKGASDIGYSEDDGAILTQRIEAMNAAFNAGHEIGSHAVGHFDGGAWTTADWISENNQFDYLMFNTDKLNGITARPAFAKDDIKGMRAPLLAQKTSELYPALAKTGFTYDTSNTNQPGYFPKKINNIWNFPLASLYMTTTSEGQETLAKFGKRTLSMDYNHYFAHTQGVNLSMKTVIDQLIAKGMSAEEAKAKAPAAFAKKIQQFEDETYWTYMSYFNYSYNGSRGPISIGHHFSKWNGGAYWNAMKRFMSEVCGKPDVRCVTYNELAAELEKNPTLAANWNKAEAARLPASEEKVPEIKFTLAKDKFLMAEVDGHEMDSKLFKKSKLVWQIAYDQGEIKSKGNFVLRALKGLKRFFGIDFDQYKSKLNLKKIFDELKINEATVRAIVTVDEKRDELPREILVATRVVTRNKETGEFTISSENLEDIMSKKMISDQHDE